MLDEEVTRLSEPYQGEVKPEEPGLLRVSGPLGLNLAMSVALGDEIVDDLDKAVHGIGWWKAYPDLDQQTRILVSDYLAACARAIPDNLVEAQVERLEHDHAAEDFRKWLSRGVTAGERSTVEPPRSPHEELATHRVQAHLAGVLRAWGSALDCVGGCIIGVAGLPSNLVKADLDTALKSLAKESQGNQVLTQLQAGLQQAEAAAGPAGGAPFRCGADRRRGSRAAAVGAVPCPGPCAGWGAARAGLLPGTGDIQRRLRLRCQADGRSREPGPAGPGVQECRGRRDGKAGRRRACRCPARTRRTCAARPHARGTGQGRRGGPSWAGAQAFRCSGIADTMNGGKDDLFSGRCPWHRMRTWQYGHGIQVPLPPQNADNS